MILAAATMLLALTFAATASAKRHRQPPKADNPADPVLPTSLASAAASAAASMAAVTVSSSSSSSSASTASVTTPSGSSVYWGAATSTQFDGNDAPWDMSVVNDFSKEDAGGKAMSIIPNYSPFPDCSTCSGDDFDTTAANNIRNYGAIPLVSWGSASAADESPSSPVATDYGFTLSDVADGEDDAYITRWAQAAKAWGHPFFLRFDWEMNGNWFTWGQDTNGNTPAEFVAAWQHVHNIFTQVGADNATWVWCPNVYEGVTTSTSLASLYPGNSYVDWTCLDGYNEGDSTWDQVAESSYNTITQNVAPTKPMMIGEFNSDWSYGNFSRSQWLTNTLAEIPKNYPQIHAIVLWDAGEPFEIEGDSASQTAFANGINSSAYATNNYGNLANSGPIAAP